MTNPNDSAYPEIITDLEANGLQNTYSYGGNSKKEEALLRFMCAIVSTLEEDTAIDDTLAEVISKEATNLTQFYFNELNKQSQ
jgi:hypothetical protein